ncbi:MAG: alginate export family protein [Flavobacteriaceae bacterium]|nr:alginate export family protein [Flavobacteriaceae bacterium]
MKKIFFYIMFVVCIAATLNAQQFKVSGEIRPRFEGRNGFGTLISPGQEASYFISQRSRISFDYSEQKYRVFFSIQNVRVWGDVATMARSDKNGVIFHEAWAEYNFTEKFSVKLGRQEIIYDDHRIFGNVEWAQQARSHDAIILKFKPNEKSRLDLGLAMNANNESNFKEDYAVSQYKNLQYAWYHTNLIEGLNLSALFLNNGLTYNKFIDAQNSDQEIAYSQTIGARLTYKLNRWNADAATYLQTGNSPNNLKDDKENLSALYLTANAKFNITNHFTIGAGVEYLSGNDEGNNNGTNNAFNPFYGTNHKFNGWMDYFYVGNHNGSVGLIDINVPIIYTINKFSATLVPHFFSADGNILNTDGTIADAYLSTEIDLKLSYKIHKNINLNLGYSQMFATESMELIKGGNKDATNNWAWAMVSFKPTFFNKNFKK